MRAPQQSQQRSMQPHRLRHSQSSRFGQVLMLFLGSFYAFQRLRHGLSPASRGALGRHKGQCRSSSWAVPMRSYRLQLCTRQLCTSPEQLAAQSSWSSWWAWVRSLTATSTAACRVSATSSLRDSRRNNHTYHTNHTTAPTTHQSATTPTAPTTHISNHCIQALPRF